MALNTTKVNGVTKVEFEDYKFKYYFPLATIDIVTSVAPGDDDTMTVTFVRGNTSAEVTKFGDITDKLLQTTIEDYVDELANQRFFFEPDATQGVEVFQDYEASLLNGSEIDTGFIDTAGAVALFVTIVANKQGLTLVQTLKASDEYTRAPVSFPLQSDNSLTQSITFNVSSRLRFQRLQVQNNSGGTITDVDVQAFLYYNASPTPSMFPLAVNPVEASLAALAQSVIIGKDHTGVYRNNQVNASGAQLTSDFFVEVSRGRVTGYSIYQKFGSNSDIDTGTAPEDICGYSGEYTGFNATSGEAIEVSSSSGQDAGSLVSSGTATGGTATTLEDTGATFVTDGVAVGDIILNDTQNIHGIVSVVTSETVLTVVVFENDVTEDSYSFESGDAYRVATTNGTGVAVVELTKMLETDKAEYKSEFIILNGTTGVNTSGTDYLRNSRALSLLSGTNGGAVGTIEATQATTTANKFWEIQTNKDQTLVACDTVPAGKTLYITNQICKMARDNGSPGAADVQFVVRKLSSNVFNSKIDEYISTSSGFKTGANYVEKIGQFSDFKWRVLAVSDNNSQFSAQLNGYLVDNE